MQVLGTSNNERPVFVSPCVFVYVDIPHVCVDFCMALCVRHWSVLTLIVTLCAWLQLVSLHIA